MFSTHVLKERRKSYLLLYLDKKVLFGLTTLVKQERAKLASRRWSKAVGNVKMAPGVEEEEEETRNPPALARPRESAEMAPDSFSPRRVSFAPQAYTLN